MSSVGRLRTSASTSADSRVLSGLAPDVLVHQHVVGVDAGCQGVAVAIEDGAAAGQDVHAAEVLVLGLLAVALVVNQLQVDQPEHEAQDSHQQHEHNDGQAPGDAAADRLIGRCRFLAKRLFRIQIRLCSGHPPAATVSRHRSDQGVGNMSRIDSHQDESSRRWLLFGQAGNAVA